MFLLDEDRETGPARRPSTSSSTTKLLPWEGCRLAVVAGLELLGFAASVGGRQLSMSSSGEVQANAIII